MCYGHVNSSQHMKTSAMCVCKGALPLSVMTEAHRDENAGSQPARYWMSFFTSLSFYGRWYIVCVRVCVCECLEKLKQRSWLCVSALLFSIQLGSDVNLFEMNSVQNVDFYSGWLMKPDINVGDCSTFGNTWRSPLHRAVIMKQCIPASLMLKVRLWRMSVFEHVCSLCNLHNANVKLVLQSSVLTGTKMIFDNWLLISFFYFFLPHSPVQSLHQWFLFVHTKLVFSFRGWLFTNQLYFYTLWAHRS